MTSTSSCGWYGLAEACFQVRAFFGQCVPLCCSVPSFELLLTATCTVVFLVEIKEADFLGEGGYRVDKTAGKALLDSTMYRRVCTASRLLLNLLAVCTSGAK